MRVMISRINILLYLKAMVTVLNKRLVRYVDLTEITSIKD